MPTALSHAFIGSALGKLIYTHQSKRFWLLSALCPVVPDGDVIGLFLGIPYQDILGHRGFSHSLFFAAILASIVLFTCFRESNSKARLALFFYFFVIIASHGVLDGLTSGGYGIAYFAPFDNHRYFLPWRPIRVSPIGISAFFTERGLQVIVTELLFVILPMSILLVFKNLIQFTLIKKPE